MILTPEIEGRQAIYIIDTQGQLDKVSEKLRSMDSARESARRTVTFIMGQLYDRAEGPNLAWAEKYGQAWKAMKGLFGTWKKRSMSVGLTVVVTASVATFGSALAVAAVAAGIVVLKKIYDRNQPSQVFENELFKNLEQSVTHFGTYTCTEAEQQQVESLYDPPLIAEDVAEEPEKDDFADATQVDEGADSAPDANALNMTITQLDNDLLSKPIGELLRRSWVHFDIARDKPDSAINLSSWEKTTNPKLPARMAITERRLGKALHHLDKGWRYLWPSIVFFNAAWTEYEDVLASWNKVAPEASRTLIEECLTLPQLTKNEDLEKALREILEPGPATRFVYQFERVGAAITGSTISKDPQTLFNTELDSFLSGIFFADKVQPFTKPNMPPPGVGKPGAQRTAPKVRRTIEPANEDKVARQSLKLLNKKIIDKMELYRSVLKKTDISVDARSESETDAGKLRRWLNARVTIENAWTNAYLHPEGVLNRPKRMKHWLRNYKRKTGALEQTADVVGVVGDMLIGFFGALGFGALSELVKLPTGAPKVELKTLVEGDVKTLKEKGMASGNKALISGGLTALVLITEKNVDKASELSRRMDPATELLTQQGRAKTMSDEVFDIAKGSQRTVLMRDELKQGAAYTGSDLIRQIGLFVYKSAQAREQFVELAAKDFPAPVVGAPTQLWRDYFPKSDLATLALRIKPLADYNRNMDRLQINLLFFLSYLELLSFTGEQIEARVFAEIEHCVGQAKLLAESEGR